MVWDASGVLHVPDDPMPAKFKLHHFVLIAFMAGPLAGCQSTSDAMDAQSKACTAAGGVLTGMGCQRLGYGNPAAPAPQTNCKTKESSTTLNDGTVETRSSQTCSTF
jgi:hypothetical protein